MNPLRTFTAILISSTVALAVIGLAVLSMAFVLGIVFPSHGNPFNF